MKTCRQIKHSISIEYECDDKTRHSVCISSPMISSWGRFDDEDYPTISFSCEHCKQQHTFVIGFNVGSTV